MVRRNVELEARLVGDLVDVGRAITGRLHLELEVVDVESVLQDVVVLCRQGIASGNLHVSLEARAAADHHVNADPVRLRQVFWNLMANAVRCTGPGGSIVIRTSNPRTGVVRIEVTDTGIGIDPSVVEELFRPFQGEAAARQGPGLGLGLSISRALVEDHGGTISASSEGLGRGATFRIELPTVATPLEVGQPGAPAEEPGSKATVLVVEDNEDNAEAIAEFLRANGYEVELAGTVEDALVMARHPFDVLVSDIGLPDGSGFDLMRRLRTERPVRGIALSGYGSNDDVRRSREVGFAVHLTKPVDPDALLRAVASLSQP